MIELYLVLKISQVFLFNLRFMYIFKCIRYNLDYNTSKCGLSLENDVRPGKC